jgi:hypothetical protein
MGAREEAEDDLEIDVHRGEDEKKSYESRQTLE